MKFPFWIFVDFFCSPVHVPMAFGITSGFLSSSSFTSSLIFCSNVERSFLIDVEFLVSLKHWLSLPKNACALRAPIITIADSEQNTVIPISNTTYGVKLITDGTPVTIDDKFQAHATPLHWLTIEKNTRIEIFEATINGRYENYYDMLGKECRYCVGTPWREKKVQGRIRYINRKCGRTKSWTVVDFSVVYCFCVAAENVWKTFGLAGIFDDVSPAFGELPDFCSTVRLYADNGANALRKLRSYSSAWKRC